MHTPNSKMFRTPAFMCAVLLTMMGGVAHADPSAGSSSQLEQLSFPDSAGQQSIQLGEKEDRVVLPRVSPSIQEPLEPASEHLSTEGLSGFIRSRITGPQGCYERALKFDPHLKGKVMVRFSITSDGKTTGVKIEKNTLSGAVGSCLHALIRGWVLPFHPVAAVTVTYPFIFSPVL